MHANRTLPSGKNITLISLKEKVQTMKFTSRLVTTTTAITTTTRKPLNKHNFQSPAYDAVSVSAALFAALSLCRCTVSQLTALLAAFCAQLSLTRSHTHSPARTLFTAFECK